MKEIDVALKTVVDGLKSITKSVEKLASKLEKIAPKGETKRKLKAKPAAKTKTKAAPTAKAAPKAKKTTAKKAPATAAGTVLAIVNRSKKGVDSATLSEKTGFDNKKIANIVFKLRKLGKIKSVSKGVYTKV